MVSHTGVVPLHGFGEQPTHEPWWQTVAPEQSEQLHILFVQAAPAPQSRQSVPASPQAESAVPAAQAPLVVSQQLVRQPAPPLAASQVVGQMPAAQPRSPGQPLVAAQTPALQQP
jgi:hypothetical protein